MPGLRCSNGHDSEWDDYCSVCGEAFAKTSGAEAAGEVEPEAEAEAEAAKLDPAATSCPNCSEATGADDVFCENCGYDFLSGTLPDSTSTLGSAIHAVAPDNTAGSAAQAVATVRVDLEFFERMQFDGVDPPAALPDPVSIALPPTDILIGRHSESRGTFPEIDLSAIFEDGDGTDPAVSSNHCRLHRTASGWTVTDLGSTNGTYVGDAIEPIVPGVPVELPAGTSIHLGAWTRIDLG